MCRYRTYPSVYYGNQDSFANHKEQAPGRPRAYDYFIMSLYVTVPVDVPVEGFNTVSFTSLAAFSVPPFGNQVIESAKITHNPL